MKNTQIPKISIIMPVYNAEKYLDRSVKSIITQTLENIEIILIDDKSTDESPKICDKYAKKDGRIKVIHKKQNEGPGYARNSGIKQAMGEYIGFVDSDDYISKDYYEKLYNRAKKYMVDISYANVRKDINGKILTKVGNNIPYKDKIVDTSKVVSAIFNSNSKKRLGMSVWRAIYKREIINKNNILFKSEKECISEDIIFNLDFLRYSTKATFVEDTYYYYCNNEESSTTRFTTRYRKDKFEKYKQLYKDLVKKAKEMNMYEEIEKGITYTFISTIRVAIKQEICNKKEKAIKNIKKICEDSLVQEVIHKKYNKTFKQKIFDFLIKKKQATILYFIISKT